MDVLRQRLRRSSRPPRWRDQRGRRRECGDPPCRRRHRQARGTISRTVSRRRACGSTRRSCRAWRSAAHQPCRCRRAGDERWSRAGRPPSPARSTARCASSPMISLPGPRRSRPPSTPKGASFAEALASQTAETQVSRLAGSGKEVVLAIATQAARVNEALTRTAEALAGTVEGRGREIDGMLGARLGQLDEAVSLSGKLVDRLSGDIGSLAQQRDRTPQEYGPFGHGSRPGPCGGRGGNVHARRSESSTPSLARWRSARRNAPPRSRPLSTP